MNHRASIEKVFSEKAFSRPLFYENPGGLRFELSEGGHFLNQFLTAHRKALEICKEVFPVEGELTVCLSKYVFESSTKFDYKPAVQGLRESGIKIPRERSGWFTQGKIEADSDAIFLAFNSPIQLLPNLLWGALSADYPAIQPSPMCNVFLINLKRGVMVHPYDDRGMDVVGPNSELLKYLYRCYNSYLLDYDRQAMRETFGPST